MPVGEDEPRIWRLRTSLAASDCHIVDCADAADVVRALAAENPKIRLGNPTSVNRVAPHRGGLYYVACVRLLARH